MMFLTGLKCIWIFCWISLSQADADPSANADPARNAANFQNGFQSSSSSSNPRITEHPQDDFFAKNEPATLNCKAEGDPRPTITWYRNGKPVETNRENPISHRMLLDNGQLFFLRVIHSKNNHPDIGEYYCNATNSKGSVISRTANIQIAVLKDTFVEEPSDTTTAVGQRVVLRCSPPRGKPDPKVIWRKNGELVQTDDRIHITEEGNLEIDSVEKQDIGEFMCLAINTGGERQSRPAQLRVLDVPVFHKLPKNVDVEEGADAQFFCDVTGDPPIKVTWSKHDGAISFGRARVLPDHTLRIENVESDDDGVYICTAENAAGSTQATARLVVFSSPTFLISPRDQVVAKGRTVSLQCVAQGHPPPTVFWSKKSQENLMFPNRDSGHYSVAEDGTLRIEAVNETDAGVYICEALNIRGAAYASAKVEVKAESAFILPDHDTRPPPIITIGPQNQTLHVDSVAVLQCEADGDPKPIIRWYKNGRPLLMSGPRYAKRDSGTLQISDLKMQDTGSYTCKAISETGETTWQAFLTVASNFGQETVKAAALNLLPNPPTQPVVSDVTDTSVHLSWSPGIQTGQAQVLSFYVEYFAYETTDGWVVASTDVKRESFTVDKLRRNTTYIFLVRAVNEYGVGYPSPVSESVRLLGYKPKQLKPQLSKEEIIRQLSGDLVEIDYTHSINSSAISLNWRVLQAENIVEGYQILYREILDIRRLTYGEKKTIRVPSTVTTYMLTGLDSYSWYEIRVLAYNGKIQSQYSHPVKVQTAEQNYVPGAPQDVTVHKISDNSVSVQWGPPDTTFKKYLMTGYKVFCVSADQKKNCSIQTDGHTFSTVISKLSGNQVFTIKVAAVTSKGVGEWSSAFIVDGKGVQSVKLDGDSHVYSTPKSVTGEESGEEDLFKRSWFVGLLIAVGGVMLWLLLCIFSVWLCKRKKHRKKMKDQRFYTGVPVHKGEESNRNNMLYPPQYAVKDQRIHCTNDLDLPPELRVLLPGQNKKEQEDDSIYKMAGDGSFPELKTFYQRVDPVAPYATTALIQQQHLMKQRQQGIENMFRPINQGYIQHSEGSADSCQKPALSTDSNPDHSHNSHSTTDHNHSDHMSPTSDSGSHTTDENGLLIKQKKRSNSRKDNTTPKQAMNMNWSEMLPPPPEHPPPSECGDPPLYSEVRGDSRSNTHSPMSPVSFSQLSACSCPNPHTQTPVSGWNMPVYSDNECPRCCSEKYYDPMTYCQDAYIRRTHSPRMQVLQHVNNRNIPNTGHTCSPRATPSVQYQYSKPHKGYHSNCATPQGDKNKSNIKRASHSSHSDNEAPSIMPCLQSYKITPKSEKDYRFMHEEWGPDPAPPCHCEHDSGMGMEEDGINIDRACQSSLPAIAPSDAVSNYNSSMQERYQRNCDSPTSEEADYATESDLEQSQEQTATYTGNTDHNTDCSSVQSSTCSSGDGTFLTEEDFASAVARAAEMSGLTVIGTTVCDPSNKSKKERRARKQARPVSPGYSTDSNYGSIDMVRKPYPKSQRKQQLIEQGKGKSNFQPVSECNSRVNNNGIYDTPYARTDYPMNITHPAFPLPPTRFASLGRNPVQDGSNRMSPLDGSRSVDRGGYSSFVYPQNIIDMHLKEDIV
ncbi:roundabout homolog 1-like isoform X3 [Ruditapes philippinarum]|uniref:roundabout homolog 1-like isoform X3 n=1 Tax=Ruditapes philippinarum TaxID=129788 RepID=UPI00295BA58E|nr:roundabout homolog 1-like isoform X3 [Ruditapes philippinarum]